MVLRWDLTAGVILLVAGDFLVGSGLFPLEGMRTSRGAGFSREWECEQACRQAGCPAGATTGTNERSSDPTARLRGLEVAFQSPPRRCDLLQP